jgi:hypothetical protein
MMKPSTPLKLLSVSIKRSEAIKERDAQLEDFKALLEEESKIEQGFIERDGEKLWQLDMDSLESDLLIRNK